MIVIGKISVPKRYGEKRFAWFNKFYDKTLKGNVDETVEESYILLGGKIEGYEPKAKLEKPKVKAKKVNAPEL